MLKRLSLTFAALLLFSAPAPQRLSAQMSRPWTPADSTRLDVQTIYGSPWFNAENFGPARWLGNGEAYTTLERTTAPARGMEMVRYETVTGARSVLIPASRFVPARDTAPLAVEDYSWNGD